MKSEDSDRLRAVFETVAARQAEIDAFGDELKVVVLRTITVEGFDTLLQFHLLDGRLRARVEYGGYGAMHQDLLDPRGLVATVQPDIVMLCLGLEELDAEYGSPGWRCDAARAAVESLVNVLLENTRATVVLHTFLPPAHPELGLVTDPQGADIAAQVDELNRFILRQVRLHAPRFVLADWVRILQRLGTGQALDARARYLWRAPFRRPFLDELARHIARVGLALKGRARKALILDCDNTLWGGVIGEEGPGGIDLDSVQYPGRVFYDFQTSVLHLAERGVLVALCSKNEEADVFEVLDSHPACRLKRSHLAAWRINWTDKAANIRAIAEELNLGLDAFVFLDDNPAECALVEQVLPQVKVLQVPKRLHELPELLLRDGLFDTLAVTDEDRQRAHLYQSEAQRKTDRAGFDDLEAYLRSLGIVARLHLDNARDVARIAQLTQKTNQFNVTTRRYTEAEIEAMMRNPAWAVYSMAVEDRFGSLGLVGVLLAEREGDVGRIDTFLLSCRALGRRLEDAMIDCCLTELRAQWGLVRWLAEYLPTRKNAQVADLWDRLGFTVEMADAAGRRYTRSADEPFVVDVGHIMITRS